MIVNRHSYICIGGPHHARLHAGNGPDATRFRVAVSPERLELRGDVSADDLPIETVEYVIDDFHTDAGAIGYWRPSGQTHIESIAILLKNADAVGAALIGLTR